MGRLRFACRIAGILVLVLTGFVATGLREAHAPNIARAGEPIRAAASSVPELDAASARALPILTLANPSPTVIDQYTHMPDDMVAATGGGPFISFAGLPGHLPGDSERTAVEIRSTSKAGNDIEETALDVEMNDVSGITHIWLPGRAYPDRVYISNDSNPNKIYRNERACTSAPSGAGPIGTGSKQADGTCSWDYVRTDNNGKSASLISGVVAPGGGKLWGQAIDVIAATGSMGSNRGLPGGLMIGQEIDVGNFAKDCPVTPPDCLVTGLFVAGASAHKGTVGILGGGQPPQAPLYHQGVTLLPYFASDVAFNDDTNANVGFQSNGTHGAYAFQDLSTSPTSIAINGVHTFAGVFDNVSAVAFYSSGRHSASTLKDDSETPVSIDLQGRHSVAALLDRSTSKVGIDLQGRYSEQISGRGFSIDATGSTTTRSVKVKAVRIADLPPCGLVEEGTFATVVDAIAATYNRAVSGGGSMHIPVYCNGVAWIAH